VNDDVFDNLYFYRATFDELSKYSYGVYDGDTIDLKIDLGFKQYTRQRVRVLGVNTQELRGGTDESKALGRYFRDIVRLWIKEGTDESWGSFPLVVETVKTGKYGRYLADIYRPDDDISLTQFLLNEGSPAY